MSKELEENRVIKEKASRATRKERQQNPSVEIGHTDHQFPVCVKYFSIRITLEGHKRSRK